MLCSYTIYTNNKIILKTKTSQLFGIQYWYNMITTSNQIWNTERNLLVSSNDAESLKLKPTSSSRTHHKGNLLTSIFTVCHNNIVYGATLIISGLRNEGEEELESIKKSMF